MLNPSHSCVIFFSLPKGDYIIVWMDGQGWHYSDERREGGRRGGSRAWQLARLALEDHGEGKFDNGGIFSGVPQEAYIGPPPP